MSRMDARYISLIGKLITKYQVMSDLMEYEEHERDLLRLAKTEYDFYHAHELREAGETVTNPNDFKKPSTSEAVVRAKLSLKPSR